MNARRLLLSLLLSLLLGSLLVTAAAQAAQVTYTFGGTLDNVPLKLWPQFAAGSSFAGSFTFEATTADIDPGPIRGTYAPGPAFEVTIAGFKFSSPGGGAGSVMVINDIAAGLDQFSAGADGAVGPAINGAIADGFGILMQDNQGTAFVSDLLLPTPAILNDFEVARFELHFHDANGHTWGQQHPVAQGSLDYLTLSNAPSNVPEPTTLALVGLALLGLTRKRGANDPALVSANLNPRTL